MMHVHNITVDLAKAGKSVYKLKTMVDSVYEEQGPQENRNVFSLKKIAINEILIESKSKKADDQRCFETKNGSSMFHSPARAVSITQCGLLAMMHVRDITVDLAKVGKSFHKSKAMIDTVSEEQQPQKTEMCFRPQGNNNLRNFEQI
jgi:hypothetical protein